MAALRVCNSLDAVDVEGIIWEASVRRSMRKVDWGYLAVLDADDIKAAAVTFDCFLDSSMTTMSHAAAQVVFDMESEVIG